MQKFTTTSALRTLVVAGNSESLEILQSPDVKKGPRSGARGSGASGFGARRGSGSVDVLRSGGSVHPVPRLRAAGLDMDSSAPYQALIRHMDKLMDEMERLIAQKA